MTRILDPRESYIFPEYLGIPYTGILHWEKLCDGIKDILKNEFHADIEYAEVREIEDEEVSSDGEFIAVVSLITGTLYIYCWEVHGCSHEFQLKPATKHIQKGVMFRLKNVRDIQGAKHYF